MNKYTRTILKWLIIVAIVIIAENFLFRVLEDVDDRRTNITMILNDAEHEWMDVKAGAIQAAGDDTNISFVMLPIGSSANEQVAAINTELATGADYVIAVAVDSEKVKELLGDSYSSRVSFIANGIDNNKYVTVQPDNYQMGVSIGNLIAKEESSDARIAIIDDAGSMSFISERVRGIRDTLDEAGVNYSILNSGSVEGTEAFIKDMATDKRTNVVVVLNNYDLSMVIDSISGANEKIDVYAIGNSDEAVYYLDNKKIKYLIYPDGFGMGYASVKRLVDKSAYVSNNFRKLINYKIVSRDDMYTSGYEKVLFPFVK